MTAPATGQPSPNTVADAVARSRVSTVVLVAANAVPLVGVLALHWQVFPLVFLYWFENVVVGVLNVGKIITARPAEPMLWIAKAFMVPFFCFHYGMFTMVHGVFVFALFRPEVQFGASLTMPLIKDAVRQEGLFWAILALVMSHIFSFLWNYLFSGEFRRASPPLLMFQPYARVVALHIAILGGGFAIAAMGSPVPALLMLVAVKTLIDLKAHQLERERFTNEYADVHAIERIIPGLRKRHPVTTGTGS